MRKKMLMMVMVCVSLVAVGCTKSEEYGCTCTHTYLNGGGVEPTSNIITAKDRGEASAECASYSNVDSSNITHSCSLD
jgi:hypothetical protein